jgi:hypothetical protein
MPSSAIMMVVDLQMKMEDEPVTGVPKTYMLNPTRNERTTEIKINGK